MPRPSSPTSPSSRRTASAGDRRPRAAPGRSSRRTSRSSRTRSAATSAPRRQRQAAALYDALGADAVTVNPYLGEEAIAPLLARGDRFAYVLCRTSNPGAAELQGLEVAADDGRRTPRRAAVGPRRPAGDRRGVRAARSGLVVGATAPAELARDPRRSRPGSRSSSRASGPRAARSPRCSPTGPATAAPAGGRAGRRAPRQRLPGHRPGGRSASPAGGCSGGPRQSASRRPPPSGPRASLCYPDAVPRAAEDDPRTRSQYADMPFITSDPVSSSSS